MSDPTPVADPHFEDALNEELFDVVDDDGNVIDPAAEGSYLMAEGLAEMVREETGADTVVFEPYVPDFDVAARRAAVEAFFEQNRARVAAAKNSSSVDAGMGQGEIHDGVEENDTDHSDDEVASNVDECDEDDVHTEEDGVDDGMIVMGSRDVTDPDDWVLEALLRRRMNKEREGGPWVYLCKWKRHEEPTWETREVMEEAGWIPQLDAFDSKGVQRGSRKTKTKIGPGGPRREEVRIGPRREAKLRWGKNLNSKGEQARLDNVFGVLESLVSPDGTKEGLVSIVERDNTVCKIFRYARMNPSLAQQFLGRVERKKSTHVPVLCYHGTRAANLPSIFRMGLVVGGTRGIQISTGAVHGNGVYVGLNPYISQYYTAGSNAMLLCVGLVPTDPGDGSIVCRRADFLVFRDGEDVCPLWLFQYADPNFPKTERIELKFDHVARMALSGFREDVADEKTTSSEYQRLVQRYQQNASQVGRDPSRSADDGSEPLTASEVRQVGRIVSQLTPSHGCGVKKKSLKGQPRRIKDLLMRSAKGY